MPEHHCPAAVPFHLEAVKDFLPVFPCIDLVNILFPQVPDWLPAAPASYWNYHSITCKTSAFLPLPFRACSASLSPFSLHPRQEGFCHIQGMLSSACRSLRILKGLLQSRALRLLPGLLRLLRSR